VTGPSEHRRGVRVPRRVPAEIRNVSFPLAVRGYDREAVDIYVARVNRVIAELEATRSPEAAVRHALAQAEEELNSIVQRGREQAREITGAAQLEANGVTARARAEAAEIVVNASTEADLARARASEDVAKASTEAEEIVAKAGQEAQERLRRSQQEIAAVRKDAEEWADELLTDTDAVWEERRQLLDGLRQVAARLQTAAETATARLPLDDPADEGGPTA
jgi:DivIVA domain-containing protein